MTNFEKWKAGLTARDFARYEKHRCDRYHTCPAFPRCRIHGSYMDCRKILFEWANAEAEEDDE